MIKLFFRIRTIILVFLTHQVALPLLKLFRKPQSFPHSLESLSRMKEGTLGNDLYKFLSQRNLPLLPHYARHDLKHVILAYDTTDEGEVCLQSFMLGNGRISFPVLATVIYGMLTMPEHWKKMKLAFQAGRRSNPFHHWRWTERVHEPTVELRRCIFEKSN